MYKIYDATEGKFAMDRIRAVVFVVGASSDTAGRSSRLLKLEGYPKGVSPESRVVLAADADAASSHEIEWRRLGRSPLTTAQALD